MGERSDVHPGGASAPSPRSQGPIRLPSRTNRAVGGVNARRGRTDGALPPRAVESFSCMFRSPRKPDSFAISSATRTDDRE